MSTPREQLAKRVEKALQRGAPQLGVKRITSVDRFISGLSSESHRVSAETSDGPATWVMRVEPEHGVIPPYDIARETQLMAEMGEAGLPVPEVLYLERDPEAVGGRFLLMSYLEGETYRCMDSRLEEDAELRGRIQSQFIETLVRLHATPQTVFPRYAPGPEAARAQVAVCRRRLEMTEILPLPVIRHALDVLDRHAPPVERLALLHGDYRLPNLKWQGDKITGILDWELATVGDPLSDLAFTQTVGAGHCSIEGELAQRYGELAGIEIDPRRVAYYRVLELVKGTIIGYAGARDLVEGGTDLRLLSVARVASSGQAFVSFVEAELERILKE